MRLCVCTLFLLASVGHARQLPVQVYTSKQGLPRNSSNCIRSGSTGVIWICSSEGLVRFDGQSFRTFGPEHGLPSRNIFDLDPSSHGGYWLTTDRGVCWLAPDSKIGDPCRVLEGAEGVSFLQSSVIESPRGQPWFITDRAIFRVESNRHLKRIDFTPRPIENILVAAAIGESGLLIGTDFGLYRWTPQSSERLLNAIGVRDILMMPSGD